MIIGKTREQRLEAAYRIANKGGSVQLQGPPTRHPLYIKGIEVAYGEIVPMLVALGSPIMFFDNMDDFVNWATSSGYDIY